jgi:hypothetical protein
MKTSSQSHWRFDSRSFGSNILVLPMRFIILTLFLASFSAVAAENPPADFAKDIKPIFEKRCYECHNADKHKGDLNLTAYQDIDQVKSAPDVFAAVLERVQAYEMPPPGKGELKGEEPNKLMRFLRTLPKPERADCTQLASDRTANFYRGYVMSRRLNRAEYNNTIRDLFHVQIDLTDLLPADGGGGEGFDTSGNALFTSTIHIENYMAAADRVLTSMLPDNSRALTAEQKSARQQLLLNNDSPRKKDARDHASKIVTRFARFAFRRPASTDEINHALAMFDRVYDRGDGFVPAIRLALKSVLVSPNFLFLAEPEPEEKGVQPLAALPLASKLSYFIWSTMPDEQLLALGESGELLKTNVYKAQIKRMLADPKAAALGERFATQWLEIDRLGSEVNPDAKKFPEFTPELRESMRREVVTTFNYIFQNDRPLLELLDSDYAFVNDRLAAIYGINGVTGGQFRKVSLNSKNRGGVTGMAAVHTLTSYPLRTSPVLRGRWILEELLGEKVPPPPPDVPALEDSAKDVHNLSMRTQLKVHRAKAECAGCHDRMDPLGFSLENFDNLGRWRDSYDKFPVDAQGTLSSGETFTGPAGLKKILMDRKDQVMRHLTRKMTGYAYGRELNRFDECVVDKTLDDLRKNQYRPSVLVEEIAMSFPFRHRFYAK